MRASSSFGDEDEAASCDAGELEDTTVSSASDAGAEGAGDVPFREATRSEDGGMASERKELSGFSAVGLA